MEPNMQRWTAGKKTELVVSILKQEKTLVDACRENDLLRSWASSINILLSVDGHHDIPTG